MYFSLCEFSHAISGSLISTYRNHIWVVIQTPRISYKDKCSLVHASGRVLDSSCECGFLFFLCDIWSCVKQRNKIPCSTQAVLNNPQMYELLAPQCVPVTSGTSEWCFFQDFSLALKQQSRKLPSDNGEAITPLIMGLSVESSCVWASLITLFGKRHQVLMSLSSVLAEDRRKKIKMD